MVYGVNSVWCKWCMVYASVSALAYGVDNVYFGLGTYGTSDVWVMMGVYGVWCMGTVYVHVGVYSIDVCAWCVLRCMSMGVWCMV